VNCITIDGNGRRRKKMSRKKPTAKVCCRKSQQQKHIKRRHRRLLAYTTQFSSNKLWISFLRIVFRGAKSFLMNNLYCVAPFHYLQCESERVSERERINSSIFICLRLKIHSDVVVVAAASECGMII